MTRSVTLHSSPIVPLILLLCLVAFAIRANRHGAHHHSYGVIDPAGSAATLEVKP